MTTVEKLYQIQTINVKSSKKQIEAAKQELDALSESVKGGLLEVAFNIAKDRLRIAEYLQNNDRLYTRQCENCSRGIDEGYMYAYGVYCSVSCLPISRTEWNLIDHENSEDSYYTSWEEYEEGYGYTFKGEAIDLYEGAEV